jgi:NTE family protein
LRARPEGKGTDTLVILAFSGGGTRAAAFSYGVLEFLRDTRISNSQGQTFRLLDAVDLITGVSGGSFTALAYGLYGEKLFDDYETRFLKRDVQGDLSGGGGPMILASATDLSTGSRFVFNQGTFDIICSDLSVVRLSRAAAASSTCRSPRALRHGPSAH